jgi:hypothetical protein
MEVTFIPSEYAVKGVVIGHPETVAAVKSEVERLQRNDQLQMERAIRAEAEVERLTAIKGSGDRCCHPICEDKMEEVDTLRNEAQRIRSRLLLLSSQLPSSIRGEIVDMLGE